MNLTFYLDFGLKNNSVGMGGFGSGWPVRLQQDGGFLLGVEDGGVGVWYSLSNEG